MILLLCVAGISLLALGPLVPDQLTVLALALGVALAPPPGAGRMTGS